MAALQANQIIARSGVFNSCQRVVGGAAVTADFEHRCAVQAAQFNGDGIFARINHEHARSRAAAEVAVAVEINRRTVGGGIGAIDVGKVGAIEVERVEVHLLRGEIAIAAGGVITGVHQHDQQVRLAVIVEGGLQGDVDPPVACERDCVVEQFIDISVFHRRQAVHRDVIPLRGHQRQHPVARFLRAAGVVEADGVDRAGHAAQLLGLDEHIGCRHLVAHIDRHLRPGGGVLGAECQRFDGVAAAAVELQRVAVVGRHAAAYCAHTNQIIGIFGQAADLVFAGMYIADGCPVLAVEGSITQFVGVNQRCRPRSVHRARLHRRLDHEVARGEAYQRAVVLVATHVGRVAIDASIASHVGGAEASDGGGGIDTGGTAVEAVVAIVDTDEVQVVERGVAAGIEGIDADVAGAADRAVEGAVADTVERINEVACHITDHAGAVVCQAVLRHNAVHHRGSCAFELDATGIAEIVQRVVDHVAVAQGSAVAQLDNIQCGRVVVDEAVVHASILKVGDAAEAPTVLQGAVFEDCHHIIGVAFDAEQRAGLPVFRLTGNPAVLDDAVAHGGVGLEADAGGTALHIAPTDEEAVER